MLRRYAKALMVRVSIVICLPEIRIFASKAAVKRVRIARDASMDGRVPHSVCPALQFAILHALRLTALCD